MADFSIGLCEVGDCKSCLYSWFCTSCAYASSRTALDGSSCCFNFFCLPTIPYRWMVRSAYGIGDTSSCWEDCYITCFCPCCTANQLYQTTATKGNPSPDGGIAFNTNEFSTNANCTCCGCLKTCFCMCCTIGDLLQAAYGMPWCLGCCCVNLFFARNTIRYQYRLKTTSGANECVEECLVPYAMYCLVNAITTVFPILAPIAYCQWVALVMVALNLSEEVKNRSTGDQRKAYLVGYNPNHTIPMVQGTVISEPAGTTYPAVVKYDN